MDPNIFANGIVTQLTPDELEARMITCQSGPSLHLNTGAIVACDPLTQWDRPAFSRTVAPGRFPVTFYSRGRLGLVSLRFSGEPVVQWELAVVPGQELGSLGTTEVYGYPVDTGLACFMDASALNLMIQREKQVEIELGDEYSSYFDNVLHGELTNKPIDFEFDWCDHRPIADNPCGAIIFSSGWGDGYYHSFWGLAADGRPVLLATDFAIFKNADGRNEDELAALRRIESMSPAQREAMDNAYTAIENDNFAALESLLVGGSVHPEWFTPETHESLTASAVRLDKPDALRLLVRHGARAECPEFFRMKNVDTYLDYARVLRKKRSQELMQILEREM